MDEVLESVVMSDANPDSEDAEQSQDALFTYPPELVKIAEEAKSAIAPPGLL